jgi:hypothetical protein
MGNLALVAPGMRGRVDELGGIKGLASGPDDSLFAVCPSAVLNLNQLFSNTVPTTSCFYFERSRLT